jgi:hypothetical protein
MFRCIGKKYINAYNKKDLSQQATKPNCIHRNPMKHVEKRNAHFRAAPSPIVSISYRSAARSWVTASLAYLRTLNCRRSNARTTPRYACVFLLAFPLLRQFGRASQATEAVTQQITRLFLLHFNESRLPPALRLIRFRGVPPLALGSLPRRTQKAVRVGQNMQRFYVYKNTSWLL